MGKKKGGEKKKSKRELDSKTGPDKRELAGFDEHKKKEGRGGLLLSRISKKKAKKMG